MMYIIVCYVKSYNHGMIVWILHSFSIHLSESFDLLNPLPLIWISYGHQPLDDSVDFSYSKVVIWFLLPLWWLQEVWQVFSSIAPLPSILKKLA